MTRITRLLTNKEILKAKTQEKDFMLHDGDGLFLLIKTSGRNCAVFAINDQIAVVAQIR